MSLYVSTCTNNSTHQNPCLVFKSEPLHCRPKTNIHWILLLPRSSYLWSVTDFPTHTHTLPKMVLSRAPLFKCTGYSSGPLIRTPILKKNLPSLEVSFGEREHHMHSQYLLPKICTLYRGVSFLESAL